MLSKIQQIEETLTKYVRMYSVLLLCLVVASWSHSMMGGFCTRNLLPFYRPKAERFYTPRSGGQRNSAQTGP